MSHTFNVKNTKYDFRDQLCLTLPTFNGIFYGKRSFRYYGAHLWNTLPVHVKGATDLNIFKTLVKQWNGPNCQCTVCTAIL